MTRRIVLYGRSLALDSIAAAIATLPGLEVLNTPNVTDPATDTTARILAFEPATIIFDLAAGLPTPTLLRPLVRARTTLIGFDLDHQHMLVMSGEQTRMMTLDDLASILEPTAEKDPCPHPDP